MTVSASAQHWIEDGDAPETPTACAQAVTGNGPLLTITGSTETGGDDFVDAYVIDIIDAANFSAAASADWDTRLFLFDASGAALLANDDARLEIAPTYGEILSDEIYERAEGWREPPMFESEWRAPKPEPKSRIRFGYDSAYEEVRARDAARYSTKPPKLRDPRPATLFRLEY